MTIFTFQDTRSFLRSYITELPRKGRGEISRIARHLSVSTTLVSQVLAGEKSFTAEQSRALTKYLGLVGIEADYLMFLVQSDRAGSMELREFWKSKLDELRERSLKLSNRVSPKRVLNEQERATFYSSPLYSAIRLYTSVGEAGKSAAEIAERFRITRAKTAEILKFLTETGLCGQRSERYFMGAQSTHLEKGSAFLPRHHSNWRLRAIRHSEELSDSELMYTAPVSLSRADFDHLREEMVGMIKKFLHTVHASPAEDVACLNLDFFWVRE
jgi:uncharacterized protein (TIGR02147 family)